MPINSYFEAQDDPQDIAAMACASFSSIYEFNSDDGYIESVNYPGRYPSREDCQWYINPTNGIPDGQVSATATYWDTGRKLLFQTLNHPSEIASN